MQTSIKDGKRVIRATKTERKALSAAAKVLQGLAYVSIPHAKQVADYLGTCERMLAQGGDVDKEDEEDECTEGPGDSSPVQEPVTGS